MLNFSKTKILLIYLTFFLISIFSISNFIQIDKFFLKKRINLGLDLQGGSYLLLEVDSSSVETRRLQSRVIPLKKKLKENSIQFNDFIVEDKNIKFNTSKEDLEKFEKFFDEKKGNDVNIFLEKYNSFELNYKIINTQINIYLSKNGIINLRNAAVDQSIEIVRRRIDEIGTKEPSILKRGSNRILVELPGIKNPERVKELLGKTAELTFRLVTDDPNEFGNEIHFSVDADYLLEKSELIILGPYKVPNDVVLNALNKNKIIIDLKWHKLNNKVINHNNYHSLV